MTKPLKVAMQMDPVADMDIIGDTSFALGLEAQMRGYELYFYQAGDLTLDGQTLRAPLAALELRDELGNHFTLAPAVTTDLTMMDVVLMRQDPPFDMAYITATHFLEKIHPATLVVNNPTSVRNAPEKLFPTLFDGLQPATMMTRDRAELAAFRAKHKDIILKPLYGAGGAGVFRVREDDENFGALIDMFLSASHGAGSIGAGREPIIAQQYLPAIRGGDKRVILVEGEAVGALNRVPAKGDARANVHVGATPQASTLSARDLEIAAQIGPALFEAGIILAGIDVIGDYLTEINITSPTCIREIKAFGGPDISVLVWDAIEKRLKR